MIVSLVLFSCFEESRTEKKKEMNVEQKQKIVLIAKHVEGTRPKIHIEQVQEKHLNLMLSGYKELEAYYGSVLTSDVDTIRFVGQDAPWKPETEGRYCIDVRNQQSTKTEHIYFFANYCRSLSTLLRETNETLYSYVSIQTCSDLCSCIMEKGVKLNTGKMDCMTFCQSLGWEVTCSKGPDIQSICCAK